MRTKHGRLPSILILMSFVGVTSGALFAQVPDEASDGIQSPSLHSLRSALIGGSSTALDDFWREVENKGAPLVERLPDDSLHHLVTFLLRQDDESVERVVLNAGLTNWSPTELTRLPKSDLWYRSFRVRTDARFTYSFGRLLKGEDEVRWTLDPLNPSIVDWPEDESLVELPDARPQPWIVRRADVSRGTLSEHRIVSEILGNERKIWVYTPAGYAPGSENYPWALFFDGDLYLDFIPTPTILDNLIAADSIPPTIVVFVDNPTPRARVVELGCNSSFDDFVITELMPWVRTHYDFSRDPTGATAVGLSRGGLAAACLAFRHPEAFGNVLSQSGAFWYRPPWERGHEKMWHADVDSIGYGWLMSQYAEAPLKPIRFYLDIGRFEKDDQPPLWHANVHMRDVLRAKGYSVRFEEFSGGHSSVNWRGTLTDGLIALLNRP